MNQLPQSQFYLSYLQGLIQVLSFKNLLSQSLEETLSMNLQWEVAKMKLQWSSLKIQQKKVNGFV